MGAATPPFLLRGFIVFSLVEIINKLYCVLNFSLVEDGELQQL